LTEVGLALRKQRQSGESKLLMMESLAHAKRGRKAVMPSGCRAEDWFYGTTHESSNMPSEAVPPSYSLHENA